MSGIGGDDLAVLGGPLAEGWLPAGAHGPQVGLSADVVEGDGELGGGLAHVDGTQAEGFDGEEVGVHDVFCAFSGDETWEETVNTVHKGEGESDSAVNTQNLKSLGGEVDQVHFWFELGKDLLFDASGFKDSDLTHNVLGHFGQDLFIVNDFPQDGGELFNCEA